MEPKFGLSSFESLDELFMKFEFLEDFNEGGKYRDVVSEGLIRLYDFNLDQTNKLASLIQTNILENGSDLDLSSTEFIEALNCRLTLRLSPSNRGIIKLATPNWFACDLKTEGYRNLIERMKNIHDGYNWLCDESKEDIDF